MKRLLLLACLGFPPVAASAAPFNLAIDGPDGKLALSFDKRGRIQNVSPFSIREVTGEIVTSPVGIKGAVDADVATENTPLRLDGFQPFYGRQKGSTFVASSSEGKWNLSATWRATKNAVSLEGYVQNLTGSERCADLKIALPFTRATTFGAFPEDKPFAGTAIGLRKSNAAVYPLVSINRPGAGLTLAIPPDFPVRADNGADASGPFVIFHFGFSPRTSPPSRAAFRLAIFPHDPKWGFRSSLQHYYELYPKFFTRRVSRLGAWTVDNASRLRNPELYAFHEVGLKTWGVPGSQGDIESARLYDVDQTAHRGPVVSSTSEYARFSETDLDEKLGILSLPYIIVGQRQIIGLPEVPANRESALQTLRDWKPEQPIRFEGPPQAVSFQSAAQLKSIIANSGIWSSKDELELVLRQYQGGAITVPQNPNPHLPGETIAHYALHEYLPQLQREIPSLDGVYVDSLGRWPGFYNFRPDHFAASTLPLTYGGSPARPCLSGIESHAEFLWDLADQLHAQKKILFGNGVHTDRLFLGFALDALGMEGTPKLPRAEADDNFYPRRVAAGSKPYAILNARGKSDSAQWNAALYEGFLLGDNSAEGNALEKKYLPVIIRLNQAGWEPVTLARAGNPAIGVERWGEAGKNLFLTVMNRGAGEITTELRFPNSLGLAARDILNGRDLNVRVEAHETIIPVTLAPGEATAIEISGGKP